MTITNIIILFLIIIMIYHLYIKHYISLELNDPIYKYKQDIYTFLSSIDHILIYNLDTKKVLYNKIETYINNLIIINDNKLKYCKLHLDKNYDLYREIINIFSSLIINIPTLENYVFFNNYIKQFNDLLSTIFIHVNSKCPNYKLNDYASFNDYNYTHSFTYM